MNYSDKDFKDLYQEILDEVKTLTTHWNPEVSDEADPGVAILKSYTLFIDKLNYAINYKNAQNSVKQVTDQETAKGLFFDLGYQIKGKQSANGELRIKLLGAYENPITLPLFTQFTDSNGKINFTSVRKQVTIQPGASQLVKVQEGIPVQYNYENREVFNQNDLTSNLRLPLYGYSGIAENGVIICSQELDDSEGNPTLSDWLNTGENIFTSVETKNIYSIGYDSENNYYIQFYEDSLPGLSKGVKIWVISSSGYGGNIPANKISRVLGSLDGQDYLVISHNEFTNGSDEESLNSAKNSYYQSFGVNNTLISERDYSEVIEGIISPTLNKLVSKALVTGIDGKQNLVEILSALENGSRAILVKQVAATILSYIYVEVLTPYLANETNYLEAYNNSFKALTSNETYNLIRKALFEKSIVSNDLKLTYPGDSESIYTKYLYDVSDLMGRVIVDSNDEIEDISEKIVKIICDNFNSSKLIEGEEIDESNLSQVISENLPGVISSSFYLTNHKLKKSFTGVDVTDNLTTEEKVDLVSREVLKGGISLFSDNELQVPPASYKIGTTSDPPDNPISNITRIDSEFTLANNGNLKSNEFIQVYREATAVEVIYGLGIRYRLVSALSSPLTANRQLTENLGLLQGSLIKSGSTIIFTPGNDPDLIAVISPSPDGHGTYTFNGDYTVKNLIVAENNSILAAGSKLCIKQTLSDGQIYNLSKMGLKLYLQDGSNSPVEITGQIQIEGFEEGLSSLPSSTPSPSENDPLLSSSQKINKLNIPSVDLDSRYYYGLILNNRSSIEIPANGSILLDEGEHLIYSDSDLLDFVDFGSGTLIKNPDESSSIVLDNTISIETDNFTSEGVLEKLPGPIEIVNTEISTFIGNSYTIQLTGFSTQERTFKSDSDFISLSSSKNVQITQNGETSTYGDDYYLRGGLIVNTGVNGVYVLSENQYLEITTTGSSTPTRIGSATATASYISFSNGVILGTAGSFLPDSNNIKALPFNLAIDTPNGLTVSTLYSLDTGFNISGSGTATNKDLAFFKFSLNTYSYLIRLTIDSESDYNIWLSGSGNVFELNGNQIPGFSTGASYNSTIGIEAGTKTFFIYISGYDTLGFMTKTANKKFNITLDSFNRLGNNGGYNENLFYTEGDTSENFSSSNASDVFTKVRSESSVDLPFDYDYRPDSPINNPTKTLQFYDSRHIMNRNILTKIDLDPDKLKNNLIIIRRNKW